MNGPRNAEILVIAEAPGEQEDLEGIPLIGKSGQLLRRNINGRDMPIIAMQNTCRCRPPENRTPSAQEVHACSPYLSEDIASLPKLKAILGVGGVPLSKYAPGLKILDVHGTPFPIRENGKTYWYYPVMHPSFVMRMGGDRGGEGPVAPIFQADMRRFFKEWESWGTPNIVPLAASDVELPQTEAEARALLARLREPIAVDIETSSPIPGLVPKPYHKGARLLTVAFSDGKTTLAFPVNHPQGENSWALKLLLDVVMAKRWIAHNCAYEMVWFLAMLNKGPLGELAPHEDTMALARLFHNRETIQSLEDLSIIHLGTNVKKVVVVNTKKLLNEDIKQTLQYNGLDALATAHIYHRLRGRVNKENYQRILDTFESTTRMELMGLPLDLTASQELKAEWETKAQEAEKLAKSIYEVKEWERTYQREFNIGSGDQVADALVTFGKVDLPKVKAKKNSGKEASGKYSTDDETLSNHAAGNPLGKAVLAYREATKMVSTYVAPMLKAAEVTNDGLLHPGYTVTLTRTGRLSSENPNIQNFPKRKHQGLRRQIPAPPGHLFVAWDYGQLEARVIAMAAKATKLIKAFIDGLDIHAHWLNRTLSYYPAYLERLAEQTNNTNASEKDIRKMGRNIIKGDLVFNALYGGGADSISTRTGIPLDIVREILVEYWTEYAEVKEWHNRMRREYANTGSVSTLTGRVRYGILWGNEPINSPSQGTGADIVIAAQNELMKIALETGDPYFMPRLQIHDDLSSILPEKNPEVYIDVIQEVMTRVRWEWQTVPMVVEAKIGENWADLIDLETFKGDYVR